MSREVQVCGEQWEILRLSWAAGENLCLKSCRVIWQAFTSMPGHSLNKNNSGWPCVIREIVAAICSAMRGLWGQVLSGLSPAVAVCIPGQLLETSWGLPRSISCQLHLWFLLLGQVCDVEVAISSWALEPLCSLHFTVYFGWPMKEVYSASNRVAQRCSVKTSYSVIFFFLKMK